MKVMKFGGSSIAGVDGMRRTAEIIRSAHGDKLVIVVSASGKTTNHLLKCYDDLVNDRLENAYSRLNNIEEEHILLISNLIFDICIFYNVSERINKLVKEIRNDFQRVLESGDDPVLKAKILSYGELLSSKILSAYLSYQSIGNKLIDSREVIITDEDHLNATPDFNTTRAKAEILIKPVLETKAIVILQGFIGSDKKGRTTLLGFEGSDYTASIIANVIDANEIYIWTDVDGVLTADPKFIDDAEIVKNLCYDEAAELAFSGAKILHPMTMKPAKEKNIPIYIRNSKNIFCKGSCIDKKGDTINYAVKSITFKEAIDQNYIKNISYNGNGNGNSYKISNEIYKNIPYSLVTLVGKNIQNDQNIRRDLLAYKKIYNAKIIYPVSENSINILVDKTLCGEVLNKLHNEFIKRDMSIYRKKQTHYTRVAAG